MEEKEPKSHILNSQMLSKDQKKAFLGWKEPSKSLRSMIKKRTWIMCTNSSRIIRRWEKDMKSLKKELYGDDKEALSKREKTRNKKMKNTIE